MQEDTAKTAAEWVFVARSIAQLPGGHDHALRCMARAGMAAQDVADWLALAEAWAQDFDDMEMSRQCVAKAESAVEDSEDWILIGDAWIEMGYCKRAIEIFRDHFEPRPWEYLNELRNVYAKDGEFPAGTTVLDWIEPGMTGRASRDSVAEAEEHIENNPGEAIRCLLDAENFADGSTDWIRIARAWKKDFQDSDSATHCMEKAEEAVDTSYDWVRIAKVWKEDYQDTDAAIACMEAAEEFSIGFYEKSSDAWEWILETWKKDFRDTDNYLRCVEKCADDLEEPWNCIETALHDDFIYDQFVREQAASTDLGVLMESIPTRIGIWNSDCVSERRPGSYARYYNFEIHQDAEISVFLESNENNSVDTYLYLVKGDRSSGEVLYEDSGSLSLVKGSLVPGTYTVEATTYEEKVTEIFTLKIYVSM